jgi:hypothetical protein
LQKPSRFLCDSLGAQREIDEARARDRGRVAKIANIDLPQNFLRDLSRIFSALFAEEKRGVGLIIAVSSLAFGNPAAVSASANFFARSVWNVSMCYVTEL